MKTVSTTSITFPQTFMGAVGKAWDEMSASFDRFCLVAGVEALGAMMEKDAEEACGARHARNGADTAGAVPKARLVFMPAKWRLSGRA